MSKSKKLSQEHKDKIGRALKGRKGKKHSEATKKKCSEANKGNTYRLGYKCSKETRQNMSRAVKGENCPFWKGGISSEERRFRRSLDYRLWKEAVLIRDNYTCQECDSKNDVCAHHIKEFKNYPELRLDVDNGQVMCMSCHATLHNAQRKLA